MAGSHARNDADEPPLELAPVLRDWTTVPVLGRPDRFALVGHCEGHPELGNASLRTSVVVTIDRDGGWARTRSRLYRLGPARPGCGWD